MQTLKYVVKMAILFSGNGYYSICLLATLCMASLAMGCDMFGFSVIVTGATCEFQLDINQTSLLLSMSFIGNISFCYPVCFYHYTLADMLTRVSTTR